MRLIPIATVSFLLTNNVQVTKASGDVAAIDRHVVSFESSHLFPDADFFGDIDATKQSSDASDNPSRGYLADAASRSYGRINAYPSFIQKMQKSMLGNINPDIVSAIFHDADEGDASFQEVQTLHLTKTSARHVDCTMTVEGDKITNHPLEKSDGLTSFYVQQADDAYLETDDDELCIPLVEGSAVSFNGGLPHRTVVKSGSVKLVGPFFLSSFASVGMLTEGLVGDVAEALGYIIFAGATFGTLLDLFIGCNSFATEVPVEREFSDLEQSILDFALTKGWANEFEGDYYPAVADQLLWLGIASEGFKLAQFKVIIQNFSPEELADEDIDAAIEAALVLGILGETASGDYTFTNWTSCKSAKSGKSTKADKGS